MTKNSRREQLLSTLSRLYWYKDKIDPIKDKADYLDFVSIVERLESLVKELNDD